ncbi:MAG: hypothetical protein KTR30_30725 [Saprospiraceae bacterium]|nr:hypothetical protein [Saprospiraceae bacterium]
MKTKLILLIIMLSAAQAMAQELNNVLKQNFQANGQVLVINIRPEFKGTYFVVAVVKANQVVANHVYQARPGQQEVDLRLMKEFRGQVDFLVTNLPAAAISQAMVRKPSLQEEFSLFFAPKSFSPGTVNFSEVKLFMGIPLYLWALFIGIGSMLSLRFLAKRNWNTALLAGFLIGSIFFDFSSISSQVSIVKDVERNYPYIQAVAGTQQFLEKVKPHLQNESWAIRGSFPDEYQKLFLRYQLAENPYRSYDEAKRPYPDFLITNNANALDAQVIEQGAVFQLLKIR